MRSLSLSLSSARKMRTEVHHEVLPPAVPQRESTKISGLAVGQLAGFPPVIRSRGLLARTGRYLWIAIRGFIGIGRILRDTSARIVRALIICRPRRGIRAPCCHRWYRSSRPRIFTTLRLEKSRPANILPVLSLSLSRLSPPPLLNSSAPFPPSLSPLHFRVDRLCLYRRDPTYFIARVIL